MYDRAQWVRETAEQREACLRQCRERNKKSTSKSRQARPHNDAAFF